MFRFLVCFHNSIQCCSAKQQNRLKITENCFWLTVSGFAGTRGIPRIQMSSLLHGLGICLNANIMCRVQHELNWKNSSWCVVCLNNTLICRAVDITFQIVQIWLPNLCIVILKMVGITGVSTCFGISVISRLFFKHVQADTVLCIIFNCYSNAGYHTDELVKQEADYSRVRTGASLYRKWVLKTICGWGEVKSTLKVWYKSSSVDIRSESTISSSCFHNYI